MSFELYKKLSNFNLEIDNKISRIRLYLIDLNKQIELRESQNDFLSHNQKFKQFILDEKVFYENKLNQLIEIYMNLNNTRYI